ncbi:single-stranded DNA-binding protein [Heliorestis acidaminivorans]|uniref:Single-stranded DNA-binding protein n=1 Tax=Heliorestis acidaminivorans TaxID=553427 RepID=A0A6I0EZ65_9FIRM|nr:single-stranded DNA-binding protein [Heliorestis acidaminivorans]KAB2952152.1 single-stranded DNA-binding protein [Heliorestis acidaminivorans]
MLNRVILIGRLGQDPELKQAQSGTQVCSFSVAVDRPQGQAQKQAGTEKVTDWISIVAFGSQAQVCKQYLAKGRLVAIEGRLQIDTWQDQQSGQKRSAPRVVAENVRFLERSEAGQGHQSQPSYQQAPQGQSYQQGRPAQQRQQSYAYGQEISYPGDDKDLPF